MRQFALINGLGEEMNMNDTNHFLYDVEGIGASRDADYEQIGTYFYATKNVNKQKKPSGKIKFNGYEKFSEFALFAQHRPLTLKYTTAAGTYHMTVNMVKLSKKELEKFKWLICDIQFENISQWYKKTLSESNTEATGKTYDYTYPYTYSDNIMSAVQIVSDSVEDSPTRIIIQGPCVNPKWTHILNGEVIARGGVSRTIPEGHRLVIDNADIPYSITEQDGTGTVLDDLYQYSDFSTQRFITLGFGRNVITASHNGTSTLKIRVEGREEYDAV